MIEEVEGQKSEETDDYIRPTDAYRESNFSFFHTSSSQSSTACMAGSLRESNEEMVERIAPNLPKRHRLLTPPEAIPRVVT